MNAPMPHPPSPAPHFDKTAIFLPLIVGETVHIRRNGKSWTAPCPFHAELTPSFHVFKDHYHCFGCGAHGDVFDWLEKQRGLRFRDAIEHLGGDRKAPATPRTATVPMERQPDEAALQRRALARAAWDEAKDARGTAVERYLTTRGVRLPDVDVIRWHPRCPLGGVALPAMVALMTEPITDQFRGVHRTFLKPDGSGKADVEKPKMMLGGAGIVQLADLEEIGVGLGLAEGIETALSVMQVIGWGPVWAATSAGAIRTFPFLRATTLNIFSDGDRAALDAARACSERWVAAGAQVLIHAPPAGSDWNDAAKGIAA
jgi:putative DNA primase/helicase